MRDVERVKGPSPWVRKGPKSVGFAPWCCNTGHPYAACPQTARAGPCVTSAESWGLLSYSWLQAHLSCGERASTSLRSLSHTHSSHPTFVYAVKPTHTAVANSISAPSLHQKPSWSAQASPQACLLPPPLMPSVPPVWRVFPLPL